VLAQELASIGARLDFRTIVVDPRPSFANAERLPAVDEIVVAWPDDVLPAILSAQTPLVVISHDPKLDLPALRAGLQSEAPYIGLLGSRRAQLGRRATLRLDGFDETALARIHGPVGLDLGGVTMAETAVSILGEIVADARGRSGVPLLRTDGTIHNTSRVVDPARA
jgi:xanthine dehydrogenase accessory factor